MTGRKRCISENVLKVLKDIPVYPNTLKIRQQRIPCSAPVATDEKGNYCYLSEKSKQEYIADVLKRGLSNED